MSWSYWQCCTKCGTRFSAILTDHPLASFIIEQADESVLHNGLKSTLMKFALEHGLQELVSVSGSFIPATVSCIPVIHA